LNIVINLSFYFFLPYYSDEKHVVPTPLSGIRVGGRRVSYEYHYRW
jgi:hypothetical protein